MAADRNTLAGRDVAWDTSVKAPVTRAKGDDLYAKTTLILSSLATLTMVGYCVHSHP
jgi:hypothetical protein